MKKHLSMLMLLAALIVPWASRAQSHTLGEYAFSTGVDATKWVSMTGATQILSPSASDGLASSVQNIGFSFPFGATNYTQYSVNTDGNLRLGATATGTGTYTTPFSSANCATNSPKINAFGCDGYGVSGSHYVKAKQHVNNDGDTLLAVEFCMGTFTSTTRDFLYKWQVHLYKNGNIEIVFPAASGIPATAPAVTHQCGMCVNASDGWIISSATNTAQHFTNGSSVTNAANTWFDANRYYSFTHPNQISCPAPRALTLTNVTTDSATFTWIPGRYETEWAYSLNGGDWVTTSDSTVTFDTLVANTPYVFEVRAVCGFDDTSASSTMTFRTECAMLSSLPYEEGFEESPAYSAVPYADAFPNCWIRINDASNTSYNYYPYITTTASYVHSGSNGMYWYHTTTNTYASNMYAVLPQVDLNVYDISDLTLAFYCKTTGTSYHPQPIVGVMTDPNNASTFTPVYTFTATEVTTSWQLFHVSLASYTGTGSYVAIKWPRPSSSSYMAIDDIFLTDTWCNVPQNVIASSTQTDVTLSWGANGVSSFTVVLGNDTISNINDSTYTVTGLTPDSTYSYAVFPECGNVLGMPVRGTIHTKCLALTAADLPYSEDFEAYGSGSAYPINSCWAKGLVTLFGTGNATNYPYPSSTAITGTRSLYFYTSTSSSTSYYNWLALPGIDATELSMSDLMLTFKMKRPSTSSYSSILVVGVTTDYSTTAGFVPVDTIDISSLAINTVSDIEVNFANYTGTGTYVLLYAPAPTMTGTSAVYNTFYIDDVVLRVTPTCYWPASVSLSNLSSDEATINWVPDSRTANPSGWIVEYDTTGFTLGEGMTMNVTDTSVTLTGLDPMTQYDVYIRANCGNGDVSDPTNVLTFRTECGPLTELPYTENFDSVVGSTSTTPTSNILPPCWSYFNHGTRTNYMYCPYV